MALIALSGFGLGRLFPGPGAAEAIAVSAVVAFVIQVGSFAMLQPVKGRPDLSGGMLIRWCASAVLRLFSLLLYGIVITKIVGLPAEPALASLAVFFFVTMLAEPLMLEHAS